jgi:hypothetical protein
MVPPVAVQLCTRSAVVSALMRASIHTSDLRARSTTSVPGNPERIGIMAQRVVVTLSDDIDGGAAEETVQFAVDGKSYEIDLSTQNAEKLREALAPYVAAGRKQSRSGKAIRHTEIAPDPKTVRAWAQSRGIDLPARGRLPKHVYEAFSEAS